MGATLIGYGNYADTGVVSGGSFLDALPLSNLRTRPLGRLARTSSADPAGTWFDFDTVFDDRLVRIYALLNHNISLGGFYRLRGSNDASFSTYAYDSGEIQAWPAVYTTDQLEWESDNFWLGQYKADDIAGYPWHLIHVLPASQRLRYWRLEIFDTGNPQGFLQGGRLFVGDAWSPANSLQYGFQIGWEDPTTSQTSLSAAEYFDGKPPYRVAQLTTAFMETDEALSQAFEIKRRSGTWKEVIYVHDVDDTIHQIRRRFPGRIRTLDLLKNPYPNLHETDWEIKEIAP